MVHLITVCHSSADVLLGSASQIANTTTLKNTKKWFLDHHWPIDEWETKHEILNVARLFEYKVISSARNTGGCGGFNWACKEVGIEDEDTVIGIDPDSNPYTNGWDQAMVEVLKDPKIAYVSLLHDHIVQRPYEVTIVNGYSVGFLPHPEMINVTAWKGSFLNSCGGLKGGFKYYGAVEYPMWNEAHKRGMICGYLMDYKEAIRAHEPHPLYTKWKVAHLGGDQRNFDQFVREST